MQIPCFFYANEIPAIVAGFNIGLPMNRNDVKKNRSLRVARVNGSNSGVGAQQTTPELEAIKRPRTHSWVASIQCVAGRPI